MDVFVARQPIFDRQQKIFGYELLFRSGLDNIFSATDGDQASSNVINNSFFVMGIDTITGGARAFINFTDSLLVNDTAQILPKELTVVEILEGSGLDSEVVAACQRLKESGYLLALDDFVYGPSYDPLLELAHFIKVDFQQTSAPERRSLVQRFAGHGIDLVAEKVETLEEYKQAAAMGYAYFQGYFFTRPEVLVGKDVPGFKLNYLRLLQQIYRPSLDLGELEQIVKREVSLSYKLLKYINSAAFAMRQKITSIRHALTLLGERNVKKWAALVAIAGMGRDKPEELVVASVIRAKFCELLAPWVRLEAQEAELFLMGMFSMIDAILDRPLTDILSELPISEEVQQALSGGNNRLADVYRLILSYERAEWEEVSAQAARLSLQENELPRLHIQALQWAQEIFHGLR